MSIHVGDIGKIIRLSTKFDMSNNTSLAMVLTKTDKSVLTKVAVLGTVPVTDKQLGPLEANKYMEYTTIAGDIDQKGDWTACAIYVDADPSNFSSAKTTFPVLEGCS